MKEIKQSKGIDNDEIVYYFRQNHKEDLSEKMILSRNLNDLIKACQILVRDYYRKRDGIRWVWGTARRWIWKDTEGPDCNLLVKAVDFILSIRRSSWRVWTVAWYNLKTPVDAVWKKMTEAGKPPNCYCNFPGERRWGFAHKCKNGENFLKAWIHTIRDGRVFQNGNSKCKCMDNRNSMIILENYKLKSCTV